MPLPFAVLAALTLALPGLQTTGVPAQTGDDLQGLWAGLVPVEPGCRGLPRVHISRGQDDQFKNCGDLLSCVVRMGHAVHANKVLIGEILGHDGRFGITVMVVDVDSKRVDHAVARTADTQDELASALSSGAAEACASITAPEATVAAAPAAAPPTASAAPAPPTNAPPTGATSAPAASGNEAGLTDLMFQPPPDNTPQGTAAAAAPPSPSLALPAEAGKSTTNERQYLFKVVPMPRSHTARVASAISLSVAGVFAVAGVGFGASAISAAAQARGTPEGPALVAAQHTTHQRAMLSNVSYGISATALVTTAVLWFAGDRIFPAHGAGGDQP